MMMKKFTLIIIMIIVASFSAAVYADDFVSSPHRTTSKSIPGSGTITTIIIPPTSVPTSSPAFPTVEPITSTSVPSDTNPPTENQPTASDGTTSTDSPYTPNADTTPTGGARETMSTPDEENPLDSAVGGGYGYIARTTGDGAYTTPDTDGSGTYTSSGGTQTGTSGTENESSDVVKSPQTSEDTTPVIPATAGMCVMFAGGCLAADKRKKNK